jgi:thiamine biosynthesis lipoprotein
MGTRFSAIYFSEEGVDANAIAAALQESVDQIDNHMSNWKPNSALSRLNASPTGIWLDIPHDMMSVIAAALEVSRLSNGAFEIGVADSVDAWGFGPRGRTPDERRIAGMQSSIRPSAATSIEIDANSQRLRKHFDTRLDLCGIAKGYAVDRMAECLNAFGVDSYLVSIDGEMRSSGGKADGKSWMIGLEKPDREAREIALVLPLKDMAIATSGDYRHWVVFDGKTHSHTIDPVSGNPVRNKLASVTVMSSSCMAADAWATALMVSGEVEGPRLAEAKGIAAFFVSREPDGLAGHPVGNSWGEYPVIPEKTPKVTF